MRIASRRRIVQVVSLLTLALSAGAARASLSADVDAGAVLAQQLRLGATTCSRLGPNDLEHLGEFAMAEMVGSAEVHAQLNQRMEATIGPATEGRMHELMGARISGCAVADSGTWMGPGMMGGGAPNVTPMPATNMPMWNWMRSDGWRKLDAAGWQRLAADWGANPPARQTRSGWDAVRIATVAIGSALGALVIMALGWLAARHRSRTRPAAS